MIGIEEFAFLNAIYLKKLAPLEDIGVITGLSGETVERLAGQYVASETVFSTPNGVMLMPSGTELVLEYYHETYEALRPQPGLGAWYERFEVINTRFIALISEWQRSGGDATSLGKAIQVVERLMKAIGELEPDIARYESYARRFALAIEKVDAGDSDYVSNPTKDSIHNVWFEFHEDILAVLGRPRDTT